MMSGWARIARSCPDWSRFKEGVRAGHRVHAYLFECGGPHAGAFFARSFVQALDCPEPDGPCHECPACRRIAGGSFPGLTEIWPLGVSITIGQARGVIRDSTVRFRGPAKQVVALYGADRMSVEAANALLKVLEEPSSDRVMVLLAESAEAVLPTIRSRCQVQRFRLTAAGIVGALGADAGGDEDLLRLGLELSRSHPGTPMVLPLLPAETAKLAGAGLERLFTEAHRLIRRRKRAAEPGITAVLDTLGGALYPMALARGLVAAVADLMATGRRYPAIEFAAVLARLHESVQKAAATEAREATRELKERFHGGVEHPLLGDEKKYQLLVGELHATLVIRSLMLVARHAYLEALGRPRAAAPARLDPEGRIRVLAREGHERWSRIACRLEELRGMLAVNVDLHAVFEEVGLVLTDPVDVEHETLGPGPWNPSDHLPARGWV